MKKVLLVLAVLIFAINLNTQAEDFTTVYNGNNIYYSITSSTYPRTVELIRSGSSSYSGAFIIPDSVLYNSNYYKVTSIGDAAFNNCSGLTSILIPNTVKSIGEWAFRNCNGLSSFTIPNSVLSIGQEAFSYCDNLAWLSVPNSVNSIGYNAFYNTPYYNNKPDGLVYINNVLYKYKGTMPSNTSINVLEGTVSVSDRAFESCSGLSSIYIPNSITTIGNAAFYNCFGLTSITIPNSVISIGEQAFYNTPYYNNKPDGLVYINNVLYKYKGTMPTNTSINIQNGTLSIANGAFGNCSGLTSITIPNSVTSIGEQAFYNCTGLNSITIPNSVTSIGEQAFYNCTGLNSITIPNSVTSIKKNTFEYCSGLSSITIPNSVTSIGFCAFQGCSGLTALIIPNSVSLINEYAFSNCTGLSSITVPNFISTIDKNTFRNCTSLTSVTIPNSVTSIFENAFYSCSNLTSLTIPTSVNYIGNGAFNGCLSLDTVYFNAVNCTIMGGYFPAFNGCNNLSVLIIGDSVINIPPSAFASCSRLTSVTMGNSVISIGSAAFLGCNSLSSITIPNAVTFIENETFKNCTGLTSIIIPNSVSSIGEQAFFNCTELNSLTIGSSVTFIGDYAFYNCSGLISITCKAINPPIVYYYEFDNVSRAITLYVPCASVSGYQSAPTWSSFTNYVGLKTAQFISDTICSNQTYTNYGVNINTAGNHILVNGCDSVMLSLFVNPSFQIDYWDTICKGEVYNNHGFNFITDVSGLYTQNLQTRKGCDSIINLHLLVNASNHDTIFAEICQGETYSQYGFVENVTGFYTKSLQTIKGCDSIVNLSLTLNLNYNDTIIAEICSNETYNANGFNENTAGFYTQNLQTTKGCDSIVNLSLVLNPISLTTYYDTICQGNIYNSYGFSFTADTTGRYTQNMQTNNGCDSIIALNLTVKPIPLIPESLAVQVNSNFIEVSWQDNGSSYVIYRNNDSLTTTTMPIYLDYAVTNGQAYCYKVKSINEECESVFTNMICKTYVGLNNVQTDNIITRLYPNPTNNKSKLEIEGLTSEADVLVYDMIGRIMLKHKINKGMNELEIDLSTYAKGVYSIRIVNESINQTKKLIVQ
ncbi:MAG: leucine-rich repeat protein [Bacteroidetes bacterium]|nr:leucine-rich repeat protein [Bacteroidota bacterium]